MAHINIWDDILRITAVSFGIFVVLFLLFGWLKGLYFEVTMRPKKKIH